jgi:hypothetical protein
MDTLLLITIAAAVFALLAVGLGADSLDSFDGRDASATIVRR